MALKGLLLTDGCADVFQLLGRQNKTGLLRLRQKGAGVDIWLKSGMIVRVEDRSREPRNRLGELLVRAGLLTSQQLEDALNRQAGRKKRLGHVLLELGLVPQQQLADFIRLQTRETLYNAFLIQRGTYEFLPGVETTPAPELAPGVRWEIGLMEGVRRAGEWPLIRKVIPTNEYNVRVLRDLSEPPRTKPAAKDEANFMDLSDEEAEEMGGKPGFPTEDMKLVFALIRPRITVQRLVDQSYLGDFATCQVLHELHKEGYVEFYVDEEELQDISDLVVEEEAH